MPTPEQLTKIIADLFAEMPPGRAMRGVTLNLNHRCPLRCRHCSVAFSEENRGNQYRMETAQLEQMIGAVDPKVYDFILLAGGEPSLEVQLVNTAVSACRRQGLQSAMVTAPIWANRPAAAETFLRRIPGLNMLILSYDRFHLEFLEVANYENAARAAAAAGLFVNLHITYTQESEKDQLLGLTANFRGLFQVSTMQVVPVGNAMVLDELQMPLLPLRTTADLARIPRHCVAGNVHIDDDQTVHGCCWSRTVEQSPLSRARETNSLRHTLDDLEADAVFQALRTHGFLDSLDEEGQKALVARFIGLSFANECHLCLSAMASKDAAIWSGVRTR